ncbi:uncharacterized protein ASPGLDRAFT_118073 [Aspergillus glaucus CBS 516.65]|uniref:Uncharacterized protein n=1 Tax=Aspergillus glaucus CBS 516.65 TaxID=1160497 RepID=A0A1L9VV83_ASPGL|nr:hypothetical protein ASPGLDRAFT_118073 [Aspergillus glaucus CBS 516.65]OJJ87816.1 hypothetical protein ASPGLDRAFT_118073 [Aspergillus glaucus CBS 516.65]
MVLGLLSIASIPTVTGTAIAVSEQRKANERKNDARRMAKFYIDAECIGDTQEDAEVHGRRVVLRDNKVYLDDAQSSTSQSQSHTAECFYVEYPETEETKHRKRGLGLVTTISSNPPALGWIYVDQDTHELKYGNRSQSIDHVVGPWDWIDDEKTVMLEDKKCSFVAVEEEDGSGWGVYFDRDGDELEGVLEEQGKLDNAFTPVVLRRRLVE